MEESDRLSVLRRELRQRLGAERYELWLGPHTQLDFSEKGLLVSCGSPTIAKWLQRNLQSTIEGCAVQAFGHCPAIIFAAVEAPAKAPRAAKRVTTQAAAQVAQQLCFADVAGSAATIAGPSGDEADISPTERPASTGTNESSHSQPTTKPPRWSFADFVVGECNRLAVQAAMEITQQPGRFSPLLVYGPVGCGKTHLVSAIAQRSRAGGSRLRVLQLTAEQFTSQFLEALEKRTLPSFRQKVRSLDVLVLDDVQFMGGKRATMEELLYTIDALASRGRQVVLASDRPAAELQAVSPELTSRISAGLAVALYPPDYHARAGIVRAAATRMNIVLEPGVIELVAQQVIGSARLLSGALNRLAATSMALRKPITLEVAGQAIAEFCRQHTPQVRLMDIQRAVCEVFGMESTSLKSARKTRAVAEPRMLAMWLARKYTRAALSEIGAFFGKRSHSTVVSAQRKFDELICRRGEIVVGDQSYQVEEALRRIEAQLRTA